MVVCDAIFLLSYKFKFMINIIFKAVKKKRKKVTILFQRKLIPEIFKNAQKLINNRILKIDFNFIMINNKILAFL